MSELRLEVTESSIDKWLREFQRKHDELRHIGLDELREIAYALHDDIPMGYEASMRLADWLLHVAPMPNGEACHADETETWECVCDGIGHYGKRLTVHVMECSECGRTYEHVFGDYEYCPHCGRRIEVTDD